MALVARQLHIPKRSAKAGVSDEHGKREIVVTDEKLLEREPVLPAPKIDKNKRLGASVWSIMDRMLAGSAKWKRDNHIPDPDKSSGVQVQMLAALGAMTQRYMVFLWPLHDARGGMGDFVGSASVPEEAVAMALNECGDSELSISVEVYDLHERELYTSFTQVHISCDGTDMDEDEYDRLRDLNQPFPSDLIAKHRRKVTNVPENIQELLAKCGFVTASVENATNVLNELALEHGASVEDVIEALMLPEDGEQDDDLSDRLHRDDDLGKYS